MGPAFHLIFRIFIALLLAKTVATAESNYSFRIAGGVADQNDFGEILSLQSSQHPTHTGLIGMDAGYLLYRFKMPFEIYIKGGLYRFLEKGYQDDFFETTLYFKLYYNIDVWNNRIRIGVAEGGSYASDIPTIERIEAQENEDHNSNFLNYLEVTLDVDVGKLLHVTLLNDMYLGYALKHRSGIYGTINSVKRGGSNYNMFYIETNF